MRVRGCSASGGCCSRARSLPGPSRPAERPTEPARECRARHAEPDGRRRSRITRPLRPRRARRFAPVSASRRCRCRVVPTHRRPRRWQGRLSLLPRRPPPDGATFITGAEVMPGQPAIVHHAILFRVDPGQVAAAKTHDAVTPGRGWTCFGNAAIPDEGGAASAVELAGLRAVAGRLGAGRRRERLRSRHRRPARGGQPGRAAGALQPARHRPGRRSRRDAGAAPARARVGAPRRGSHHAASRHRSSCPARRRRAGDCATATPR